MHCLTALGQWAVELLLYTASLPWGSGEGSFFCTLPHCTGAVGSGTPSIYCLTALGQWAVALLLFTASLPWGNGLWDCFSAPPHC